MAGAAYDTYDQINVLVYVQNKGLHILNTVLANLSWHRYSTLQRKSHLCIPILGLARPHPQLPHSCAIVPGSVYIFPPAE